MKRSELIEAVRELELETKATRKAVQDLEEFVKTATEEFAEKKAELRDLTDKLQEAVRADAKATVKLLKAQARARLLGLLDDVTK